ncbi:MAG: DUF6505 family protein [Alphaproteobacteria bacterium]
MRFPRAIRLDDSDSRIFERAADPGEWAVPGSFAFADVTPEELAGKRRQAFAQGFLGTRSFGRTTLVEVAEIDAKDFEDVIERLALHFISDYGAPDLAAARPPARAEAEFAAGLCDHKLHTLLVLEREFTVEGVVDRFRVVAPRASAHAKIWSIDDD